jgi:diaminopimelate decarboxylase|tara:strand:- start:138 stop:1373 length:1236 start_codon:yes stop_codon:yes gene_type:complete
LDSLHYQKNKLFFDNLDLEELSKGITTPFYLYSENLIKQNIKEYISQPNDKILFCYSVKANSNLSILKLIASEGMGFDVVSKGELYRVIKAGGDTRKVVYSGVGKTRAEIRYALENNILCFNVESEGELFVINDEASAMGTTANISIRVNPDVAVESHPYISTGMKDNKFGITYKNALALYRKASKLNSLNIIGIDFHIGSQITSIRPYIDSIKSIRSLVNDLKKESITITHIDVGGGLGISYEGEDIVRKADYIREITDSLKDLNVNILFEPGRSVIGDCGLLVTQIQYIKESEFKNFMIIDASMSELIRPPLYNAFHKITPIIKRDNSYKTYDIVGPVCESADFLGKERSMNSEVYDLLVIEDVGAYGFVLSSNYNTRPKPAEYIIKNGSIEEIRTADTLDQILTNELK